MKIPLPGSTKLRAADAQPTGEAPVGEFPVTIMVRRREALPSLEAQVGRQPRDRTYLSREQHAARHGAAREDLRQVVEFAEANRLRVVRSDAAMREVVVSGTADDYRRAFEVELRNYQHKGRICRCREGAIFIPEELENVITSVTGLDNRPVARPHFRVSHAVSRTADAAAGSTGTAIPPTTGGFTPTQIAALYNFPPGLDGSGQTIAILELGGGFRPAELSTYFQSINLTPPNVIAANYAGGGSQNPGTDALDPANPDVEVMLDIQVVGACAPGAKIVVYFAPDASDQSFLGAMNAILYDNENRPSIVSISWGGSESVASGQFKTEFDQMLQSAAHLGLTVCVASGDNGSADFQLDDPDWDRTASVDFPASSPFALACGGTRIGVLNGALASETTWHDAPNDGTGGGVSRHFPLPDYQAGAKVPNAQNPPGPVMRGVPDVAGNAAPGSGYRVLCDGQAFPDPTKGVPPVGGTSAVAPLWAGLVARLNQGLGKPVGFINPLLYRPASDASPFRDVTEGDNGDYRSGPGWDPCTGLGSPNGVNLLRALM
jgi:kumamolisin